MARLLFLLGTLLALSVSPSSSRAAELRVTLEELTRLIQGIAKDSKAYLNSVPGELFTSPSFIEIRAQKHYLPPLFKEFTQGGSKYAYYVKDISSTEVTVSAVSRAVRLTIVFETDGPEAVPRCVSGECNLLTFFPEIEWTRLVVVIDLIPIRFNGSISLQVQNVTVGGLPQAVCRANDLIARAACNIGRSFAKNSISRLKTDLPKFLRDAVNDPGMQQKFAEGLKAYLTVGESGMVSINQISIQPGSLTVDFRFKAAAGK